MKRNDAVFPFRFTPLMIAAFALLLLLCAGSFSLTTWQFTEFLQGDLTSVWEWLKYFLLYLVSILLAVLSLAMLIRSRYILTKTEFIMQFGLIKTRYPIARVVTVQLVTDKQKLVVFFDEFRSDSATVVIDPALHNDFLRALTERNESVSFDFTSAEEENAGKKKK